MSQHFNSMLEHLKMAGRRPVESSSSNGGTAGANQNGVTGGGGGSISALIQKFSSPLPINKHGERPLNNNTNKININNNTCSVAKVRDPQVMDEVDCAVNSEPNVKSATFFSNICLPNVNQKKSVTVERKKSGAFVDNNMCKAVSNGSITSSSAKRQSVSSQAGQEARTRDLSPCTDKLLTSSMSGLNIQRKLSGDYRNNEEGGIKPAIFKPIRVKNITTKAETYDTLHCKAIEKVSGRDDGDDS